MNEAIGWALFHFLWEGAAIALVLAVVLAVCNSARVRYGAACGALLAMLAAFGVTLGLKMPGKLDAGIAVHVPAGRLAPRPADSTGTGDAPLPAMPYQWAVPLWMAGVAVFTIRRLAGFAGTWRLRRTGVRTAPAPWPARMAELGTRLGIRRTVQLMESCLTEVPVVTGYLRPVILLPVGMLAGLPVEQVEYILIHELAHIARRDYLVNVLQGMVEALLFYHPAVWWVSATMRAEREHCCDDAVVAVGGDARGYAAALVRLEQARALEPALAATGGSLTRRVRRLLRQPAPQSMAAPLSAMGLALVLMGVALAASDIPQIPLPKVTLPLPGAPAIGPSRVLVAQGQVQRPVMKKDSEPADPAGASQAQTPYRKWLTEDVAYIITDAERKAFKNLQTTEEQEQFIEQFWQRRDPTPGTDENEFKEEHYRRIAYANEHFSSQTLAGWKTDRGRVYITYGPPDEIEDHSSGGTYLRPASQGGGSTSTYPFQQWRYKLIEGVGQNVIIEFVDPNMTGEFRMTADPSEKDALLHTPSANEFQRLEQFAKLQKGAQITPAAVPVTTGGNVFVANEPGGRVTVTVFPGEVPPGSGRGGGQLHPAPRYRVVVSLPFPTAAPYSVEGRYTRPDGTQAAGFGSGGTKVRSQMTNSGILEAGSYLLTIVYKNQDTGESRTETVNFYIN